MLVERVAAVTDPIQREGVALAGGGGYGRGAVALGADLDVRLLAPGLERAEPVAEALLYPLWDSGLPVGHQVQTVDALIEAARTDLATATSLLDWRHVAGDRQLEDTLQSRARQGLFLPSELPRFLERLEAEVAGRHRRFGGSVYLLEPDVKNGPGGLRDVDVARWAAQARWGVRQLDGLLRLGVLMPRQLVQVQQARELLWRIRNALHGRAGRRSDRLGFDVQEPVARTLGYAGPLRDAVERFMSDYYRAARVLSRFRQATLVRAKPNLVRRKPRPRKLGDSLELFGGFVTTDVELLRRRPEQGFRLIAAAVEQDVPLSPHVRDVIAGLAEDASWCAQLRASAEAAHRFIELVACRRRSRLQAGSVMRELHELGLLLAMIPEFGPLVGRVHHDTYHVYTVDVHSVAAVDRLGEIMRGDVVVDQEQLPRWEGSLAVRLSAEITRPTVLFFATLLHDVGKAIGRADHSERGAQMAREVLERLGFASTDVADACRLIANHLLMYRIATRRDLDDPTAVADLVAHIGSGGREALCHLYLLTVADTSTTSPTSMTAWKASMLDALFLAADEVLRGAAQAEAPRLQRYRAEVLRHASRVVAAADGLVPPVAFAAEFLGSMPDRYLLANAPEAIAAHAELARCHGGQDVSVALQPSPFPQVAEIAVIASDRPGLLAAITAALGGARLEVHAAQIHSRATTDADGGPAVVQAVDLFWVRTVQGGIAAVSAAMPRLRRDLSAVLAGRVEPREIARVTARSRVRQPAVATKVVLDNRASLEHTVIEVFARDRPGLLFSLSNAMFDLGLSIAVAKINTEGERAIDVFYVHDRGATKVCLDERGEELRKALVDVVESTDELREES